MCVRDSHFSTHGSWIRDRPAQKIGGDCSTYSDVVALIAGASMRKMKKPNQSPEPMPASARFPAGVTDMVIESARPADGCRLVAGIGSS
jgi:hypothetical protein